MWEKIIIPLFFLSLIAGCITPAVKNSPLTITGPTDTQPVDFVVAISTNGLGNITGTITRNFSEIQSRNYRDIPLLLDLKNSSYCGYSSVSNYSAVADVALHDSQIRKMLQDGGIIKGIYVWGPSSYTKEQSGDPCAQFYVTLELDYHGKGETALINETTHTVILPPDVSPYLPDSIDPSLTINPVGDHAIGDIINITGTTDFPPGTVLWISAGPRIFTNYEPNYFVGQTAVIKGSESNLWSILMNTSLFTIDEYSLNVEPLNGSSLFTKATFNITPRRTGTPVTFISMVPTAATIPEDSPYVPTPKPASLPVIMPGVAIGFLALFWHYRNE